MCSKALLTSDAGPLSPPGQEKVTNSWQRLWTTKAHTGGAGERERTSLEHFHHRTQYFKERQHKHTLVLSNRWHLFADAMWLDSL